VQVDVEAQVEAALGRRVDHRDELEVGHQDIFAVERDAGAMPSVGDGPMDLPSTIPERSLEGIPLVIGETLDRHLVGTRKRPSPTKRFTRRKNDEAIRKIGSRHEGHGHNRTQSRSLEAGRAVPSSA